MYVEYLQIPFDLYYGPPARTLNSVRKRYAYINTPIVLRAYLRDHKAAIVFSMGILNTNYW